MKLTVKELKEAIDKVPDDAIIYSQRIEDMYIEGRNETHLWQGKHRAPEKWETLKGWETYDMPCDLGSCSNMRDCKTCEYRNQYITASRCFIFNNQLFIDGHY